MINSRAWLRKYLPILERLPSSSFPSASPSSLSSFPPSTSDSSSSSSSSSSSNDPFPPPLALPLDDLSGINEGFGPYQSYGTHPLEISQEPQREERSRRGQQSSLTESNSLPDQLVLSAENVSVETEALLSSSDRYAANSQANFNRIIDSWEEVHGEVKEDEMEEDGAEDGEEDLAERGYQTGGDLENAALPITSWRTIGPPNSGDNSGFDAVPASKMKRYCNKYWKMFRQRAPYYIPVLSWLPKYSLRDNLVSDLMAGLSIAAILVPQGIAYSSLANVDPQNGLYTAFVPLIVYFIFGTSRQLCIGPEGVVALLTGTTVASVTERLNNTLTSVECSTLLAFLVGSFLLILGVLRLGFLDNLLSRPMLLGFVSASGSIIFCEQVDSFLGFSVPQREWEKLVGVAENLNLTNWYSVGLGIFGLLFCFITDNIVKKKLSDRFPSVRLIPSALLVVIITTLITWGFDLGEKGVRIIGEIKSGPPMPKPPLILNIDAVRDLLIPSILIAIVGYVESNAIAKAYASKNDYPVSSNRELVALGFSNSIGSFFGSFPCNGSLSRSKVADTAGMKTQLAGVVVAIILFCVLLFMMPLFYYLPKSAIAGIIMVAAANLIHLELAYLTQIKAYREIFLTLFTFCATFFLGAELGIVFAVLISLFLMIKHSTVPSLFILGRDKTGHWRDIGQSHDLQLHLGTLVIRIDDSLYFANVEQVAKMIYRIVNLGGLHLHPTDQTINPERITGLVLDIHNVHTMDAVSLIVLKEMAEDYKRRGVEVCFARMSQSQMDKMELAKIVAILGHNHFHRSINDAVKFLAEKRKEKMRGQAPQRGLHRKKSGSIKLFSSANPHNLSDE